MDEAPKLRVLILGGSSEATDLCARVAEADGLAPILSLAGRTREPTTHPVPTRVGGFGGVDGLAAYLDAEAIDLLVDATHPFAERISRNAAAAARRAECPLIRVGRPPWRAEPDDRWTEVATMDDAVAALGEVPRRVFLTIGRLRLAAFAAAPQHSYLIRTIDPIDAACRLPQVEALQKRGPFTVEAEEALMRDRRIDVLVTKNSGGTGAAAKLVAARRLGLPVILLQRPEGEAPTMDVAQAFDAILAHRAAARRGV